MEVTEELIARRRQRVVELGWVKPGERVGITAGLPVGEPGTTSLFQVQTRLRRGSTSPPTAITISTAMRRDRLGRAEVVERAAQRGVGERARRGAERGRGGERRQSRSAVEPGA